MKLKKLALALSTLGTLTTLAAAVTCTTASAAGISDNVVKIGVMTDMAGTYAQLTGPGSILAARLAVADFGGKVLGKPIEIITADHQNKPDLATVLAKQWFEANKVDMITDLVTSSTALAVSQVAKEKHKLILVTGAATQALTGKNCDPMTVHWVYDTYALTAAAPATMVASGGKKWYFVTADYAFGQALESAAVKGVEAAGGSVSGAVKFPFPGTTDFSSYLLRAQSSKADVIGLANAGTDLINSVKQAAEYGVTETQQLVALLGTIADVHQLGLKDAKGMTITEGFYWDTDDQTRAWSRRFFEVQKVMPTMLQAGVYSAVTHYLKAVQAAGTDDSDAVLAKMRELPVNDMMVRNGKLLENNRMAYDMKMYVVKKPSESKYAWDYYTLKTVIPASKAFLGPKESGCPRFQ